MLGFPRMVKWYTWTLYSHGVFCSRTLNHAVLFCRTHDLKFLVRLTSYVKESLECYTFFSDIRHVVGNDAPIPHLTRVLQSIFCKVLCKYDHISGFGQMTFLLTSISTGSKLDCWWKIFDVWEGVIFYHPTKNIHLQEFLLFGIIGQVNVAHRRIKHQVR